MRLPPAVGLAVAALLALAPSAAAQGGQGQQRLVTIAARSCPSYEAITANRARNNIMESLKDLGVDTPYGSNGLPLIVNPAVEAQVQPLCTPIANWAFTLGKGYQTRAVPGVWGSLSKVTSPFSPTIYTQQEVPLRDSGGNPTGTQIGGATTITLTSEQRDLATTSSRLWIQGGTPTLPITDPETYAFGALRCATDNLNGDNVEWISYPPNTTHVFCFAYYVKPAPTSGTITVVKEATLAQGALPQKVRFTGNISYENSEFFLTPAVGKPDSKSFIRAAGSTWTFAEEPPALATLTGVSCRSETGGSTWTIDGPATSVQLGAGDHVTCTYENRYRRPPSGLAIRKVTLGGIGTTRFGVTGEGEHVDASATTDTPGIAVEAEPSDAIADLPAGTYRINEQLPPDIGGTWTFERVNCLPDPQLARREPIEVEVPVGPGTICTFFNRFTPAGRITLRKITLGGTASTRFQVRPEFGDTRPERQQLAVTTEAGEAVEAEGDSLDELPVGEYSIQETIGGADRWEVARVECDGVLIPAIKGRITLELTADEPHRDCTFVNRRIGDDPPPDPPPTPTPPVPEPVPPPDETGVAGETVPSPVAELRVTKQVQPRATRVGGLLRYTATVVNRGPDPAQAVTIGERYPSRLHKALSLRISKGSCRREPPRFCALGTLAPGERVTIRVAIRPRRAGRFRNAVAVNTATQQQTERGKRARARAVVRARQVPRFTG
jgi:uncharacterized repeat protein (TIGR01451 family)